MIVLLVTRAHSSTHRVLRGTGRFDLSILSYHQAFRARSLKGATYIFGDLDRLGFWELELASRLYRQLEDGGCRVLNDPARVRQRFSLLRTLKDRGYNLFNVWRVEDTQRPSRFPVFLRTQSAHRGPISDLLNDQDEVESAIEAALMRGYPRRELILIEYCAEPVAQGIFKKNAIYRVGDRMVPCLSVHEGRWKAKQGQNGIADQALYDEEHEMMVTNRHAAALRPAFDAAEIEYGRADFGLVDGRPQVYEINTNPQIKRVRRHPFPIRVEAGRRGFELLLEAFAAIDTPVGPRVKIVDSILARQRWHDLWMTRPLWTR